MMTLGSYKTSKEQGGGPCRKPASFQSQTTVQSFQRRCEDSDFTGKGSVYYLASRSSGSDDTSPSHPPSAPHASIPRR